MIKITVPIYYQQSKKKTSLLGLNWYRNAHYRVSNNAKKFFNDVVKERLEGDPILEGKIHVAYKIYLQRKGTDGGNVRSVIEKFVLDAIKKEGFITDDNAEVIVSDSAEYGYDKDFPRAEITLTEKNKKIVT